MNVLLHALGITDATQLIMATMVFLLLPGPGTFCVLTCTARRGLRGGFACLTGLMLGDAVLMLLAALGVAALLQAHPLLFKALQYVGAVYLAWLGIKLLLARQQGETVVPFAARAEFARGFLVTLFNPKAIVFYMAFFPLFIDPATHQGGMTFIVMGALISLCTLLYGSLLVVIGNAAAARLAQHRRIGSFASKLAGMFLIGFGLKLTTN